MLGTLPGGDQSRAFDISNSGKITGVSNGTDGIRAFIYDIGTGTMDTLGPDGVLGTGTNSWGYSINDAGWVVGNAEFDNLDPLTYEEHAFIWKGTDLEDLSMPGTNSRALAISEGGVIIGSSSYDVTMKERAAKWEYNIGTGVYDVTDLGAIQGAAESVALGINIGGDIVGWSLMDGTAINRAFIYSDVDNTMYDLNDQLTVNPDGWTLSTATGINDFGWIIGEGQVNGEYHAFILKPVPEPATMMLMALGGLMIRKRS